jgi:hypothetical protein
MEKVSFRNEKVLQLQLFLEMNGDNLNSCGGIRKEKTA